MEIREVKIEEYWPLIVKNTEEFGQIAVAENPEFNQLAECIYRVLKDGFIHDATEYGVSRWENMLGLAVTPDMTLDDRKAAILTYLSCKIPYTWRVLKQMLTGLLGEDNFEMSIDNDTQTVTISLTSTVEHMREKVDELCARVVPQNLVIEVDDFPIDYTPVKYLNSTGKQYIDTEVYNFDSFIIDYKNTGGSYWNNILGHVPSGYTRRFAATSGQYIAVFNPNQNFIRGSLDHNPYVRNVVEYSIAMGGKLVLNGEIINLDYIAQNPVYDTIEGDLSAYLFASNLGTSLSYGYAAIYGCKMIDNAGVIVRDFIPALDNTGTPCMFDIVTHKPFYNSGSGDFSYPTKAAPVMTLDLDEKFYAQMTEHGIRRLYHVPEGCTMSKDEYAAKNGFKEILEPPMPLEGYWVPQWKETETQLICEWVETEPPTEEGIENE